MEVKNERIEMKTKEYLIKTFIPIAKEEAEGLSDVIECLESIEYHLNNQVQAPVILQGELLPCPFCGNEAELIEKGNNYTKKRFITIKCTNKNCRAEMTNGAIRNDMNWLKEISTNAWNKRAGREPQSK